jgi:hypothetical protein
MVNVLVISERKRENFVVFLLTFNALKSKISVRGMGGRPGECIQGPDGAIVCTCFEKDLCNIDFELGGRRLFGNSASLPSKLTVPFGVALLLILSGF